MTLALLRHLQLPLVLAGILALSACDSAQLLPPDARLPDGSTYSGDIRDGLFHGEGVQLFPGGMIYRGQFREGYWHGQGELESPAGWRYEGDFEQGMMSGQGIWEDRFSRYEGAFRKDLFNGQGRMEVAGAVYEAEFVDALPVSGKHITPYGTYEGEFSEWQYHGEGTYRSASAAEGDAPVTGSWEYGSFLGEYEVNVSSAARPLTEVIIAEDRQRLQDQIDRLQPSRPGVADVYFLAVGGDGTESVFMRDIEVARAGLQARVDVENRSIMLLNHRDYETLPLATRPSIATALKALDGQMNPEEDLLFIHLVTHGASDGELLLRQPGIELPDLSPGDFAEMLDALNVQRRVLVVSACYSGHWLNELKSRDSLVLTSARDDRTSFGCGDDSEMTWFSKALYQDVGLSFGDPDAMFEQITQQIREWEEEIGMDEELWSYPQMHLGEDFRRWLAQRVSVLGE
jgi:hypothetical protein